VRPDGPVLTLTGIRVVRGTTTILDIPAFEARAGEVVAIIGPNGAGKSTLLRVAALLEAPHAGKVIFRGSAARAADGLDERRRMATVFQTPLLADTTAVDNTTLGLRFRGVPADEARRRAVRALDALGVGTLASRNTRTLSGGEAQRVALARALVLEPELLLLDEPFAALDQPTRDSLVADLGSLLRRGRITTLLVTHERAEAQALADRVGVLMGGRLLQLDATMRVFQSPLSEEVARFVGVETIVTGRVMASDGGLAVIDVEGRKLEVAATATIGEVVRLCVRPEDVTLVPRGEAHLTSARNRLEGRIATITPALSHLRVIVDCGFPLAAAITRRSLEDLALAEGATVTAVFKASAVHLIPFSGRA